MADRKQMLDALKAILIPGLKCDGFSGSLPHYRHRRPDFCDLMSTNTEEAPSSRLLVVSPSGIEHPTGHVQAGKARKKNQPKSQEPPCAR
jgi:hypothetical protein